MGQDSCLLLLGVRNEKVRGRLWQDGVLASRQDKLFMDAGFSKLEKNKIEEELWFRGSGPGSKKVKVETSISENISTERHF